eukprot:scaffold3609_cov19-Prasinocladus_malaysianus.AAC.1
MYVTDRYGSSPEGAVVRCLFRMGTLFSSAVAGNHQALINVDRLCQSASRVSGDNNRMKPLAVQAGL